MVHTVGREGRGNRQDRVKMNMMMEETPMEEKSSIYTLDPF